MSVNQQQIDGDEGLERRVGRRRSGSSPPTNERAAYIDSRYRAIRLITAFVGARDAAASSCFMAMAR